MKNFKNYFSELSENLGFAAYVFRHLKSMEDSNYYLAAFIDPDNNIYLLGSNDKVSRDYLFWLSSFEQLEETSSQCDWSTVQCARIEYNDYVLEQLDMMEYAFNIFHCDSFNIFYELNFKTGIYDLYSNYMDEYCLW